MKPNIFSAGELFAGAPRAVHAAPRADTSLPANAVAELNKLFAEFKAENDKNLASKANAADVVAKDKIDKLEAALQVVEKTVDEQAAKIAASKLGAGVGDLPASTPEEVAAFKAHMRSGEVSASLKKAVDGDGGYLAPVEWDRTITSKLKQVSPIRDNARVITIGTAGFRKLFNDRNVGSGWVGETAARPETTTPQIGMLDFATGEIYANPAASQQLLDDAAVDIEKWLADEVELEFSRQEGIAFLSGDGTNKPFGILNYVTGGTAATRHPWGAIAQVVSGNAANIPSADPLIDLVYDLPGDFEANAKVYLNRSSMRVIRKFKDAQGQYLWQPALEAGQRSTLLGAPIVDVPGMPAIGAGAIPILYGDMDATYLVVDRVGIRVLRDPYTNKPFVMFYTTKRVGGGVHNPEPMRALRISA